MHIETEHNEQRTETETENLAAVLGPTLMAVSYTHLTLPTIYSV